MKYKYLYILTWDRKGPVLDTFYECQYTEYYNSTEEFTITCTIDPSVKDIIDLPEVQQDMHAITGMVLRARMAGGRLKEITSDIKLTKEALEILLDYYHKHEPEHKILTGESFE